MNFSSMLLTCPVHLILRDLINIIILREVYKLRSTLLYNFSSSSSLCFYPFYVKIFSSATCSQLFWAYVIYLIWQTMFHTHKKLTDKVVLYNLSPLSLSSKNQSRLMLLPCCLCIPLINFKMPEPIFIKLGMHITESESVSKPCLINLSHQSMCLHTLLGNGSVKSLPCSRTSVRPYCNLNIKQTTGWLMQR
jgi:hypothetical protein